MMNLSKRITMSRGASLTAALLVFVIGVGAGIMVGADAKLAIITGAATTGAALWVGLR